MLHSLCYHHTETNEWSKITKIIKIQFYKYEHMVVKFVCECIKLIIKFSASGWLILINKQSELL